MAVNNLKFPNTPCEHQQHQVVFYVISRKYCYSDTKDQPEFLHLLFCLLGFCSRHPSNWICLAERAVLTADVAKPFWQLPDYRRLSNGRWHLSRRAAWQFSFAARKVGSSLPAFSTHMFHGTACMDARANMVHNSLIWPLSVSQDHLSLSVPV